MKRALGSVLIFMLIITGCAQGGILDQVQDTQETARQLEEANARIAELEQQLADAQAALAEYESASAAGQSSSEAPGIIEQVLDEQSAQQVEVINESEGGGFRIELGFYEFRPKNDSEPAAISYDLVFINDLDRAIEIQFNTADILGVDNVGTYYGDYYALGQQWYEATGKYDCTFWAGIPPEYPTQKTFVLEPNSQDEKRFYLNVSDVEGKCYENGLPETRVSLDTTYVDLTLARLSYQGDQYNELTNLQWRLTR